MKIVYMGTPQFAAVPLEKLYKAGHSIELVVSQPDRPKDRGHKLQACPVKLKAQELGLTVETPEKIRGNEDFIGRIKNIAPELIVVAAFGQILPKEVLDIPRYGCVNIHASLLPEYRGAAPIHRAIMDGKRETGVSLMFMAEKLDTGDVFAVAKTDIGRKNTPELFAELAELGGDLLVEKIPEIENGSVIRVKQDDSMATYAKMVFKDDGIIDFSRSPEEIDCLVRGLYGGPSAWTMWKGEKMKVHEAHPDYIDSGKEFGAVLSADKSGIAVACKGGSIIFDNIQVPGKKAMEVNAFLLGNKIDIGTILG